MLQRFVREEFITRRKQKAVTKMTRLHHETFQSPFLSLVSSFRMKKLLSDDGSVLHSLMGRQNCLESSRIDESCGVTTGVFCSSLRRLLEGRNKLRISGDEWTRQQRPNSIDERSSLQKPLFEVVQILLANPISGSTQCRLLFADSYTRGKHRQLIDTTSKSQTGRRTGAHFPLSTHEQPQNAPMEIKPTYCTWAHLASKVGAAEFANPLRCRIPMNSILNSCRSIPVARETKKRRILSTNHH